MKKLLTIVFCLLTFGCTAIAQVKPVPFMWHVHTIYSDGNERPLKVKKDAISRGYQGIGFFEHSDCFVTHWAQSHDHPHPAVNSFTDYQEEINTLVNQEGKFVALAGREITLCNDPASKICGFCHFNVFSFTQNPYLFDGKDSIQTLSEFINDVVKKEDAICIYNHPKDCKELADTAPLYCGIELMNDLNLRENYQYHLNVLLKTLRAGTKTFVVGGIDFHHSVQRKMGKPITYIFPDNLTQKSVFSAIREGRTIAAANIELMEINPYPHQITQEIKDAVVIKGRFKVATNFAANLVLVVYKNGEKYSQTKIIKEKAEMGNVFCSFGFTDDKPGNKEVSYVLEIPGRFVSSPYYFMKRSPRLPGTGEECPKQEKATVKQLGKVFKVLSAEYDKKTKKYFFTTENDDYTKTIRFVDICGTEDLLYAPGNLIIGCRQPLFTIGRAEVDSEKVEFSLQSSKECKSIFDSLRERCLEKMKNGYLIAIGENDYRATRTSSATEEFLVLTEDKSMKEGSALIACDPEGEFTFSSTGQVLGCTAYKTVKTRKVKDKPVMRAYFGFLVDYDYFILIKK